MRSCTSLNDISAPELSQQTEQYSLSTLPPPVTQQSRSAPLSVFPAEAAAPRSRPAPLAGAQSQASAGVAAGPGAKSGGSKVWVAVAGVLAVVALAAAAAWQFGVKRDAGPTDPALSAASAALPLPAAPVPATTATTTPAKPPVTTSPAAAIATPAVAPATTTATTLPGVSRSVPAVNPRPATTAVRNELPANPGARLATPDRTGAGVERSALSERPVPGTLPAAAASAARARPVGQPVPRPREPETTTAGPIGSPGRPPENSVYNPSGPSPGNASVNPNERPRPLGQPPVREPVVVARPVPAQPVPVAPVEAQPATARDACGKRVFIALALCMEEKCDEARYRNAAECVSIMERKRARESR